MTEMAVTQMALSRRIYETRINAAMDLVEANLSERLNLADLAGAASFSPFHFHRIFTAVAGETPTEHVRRVRIERAAALLVDQPTRTVSAIAAGCGFGTPSAFSREFKAVFSLTPGQWRSSNGLTEPNGPTESDARPALRSFPPSAQVESQGFRRWRMTGPDVPEADIRVEPLEQVDLAYLRHTGPFQGSSELFGRLFDQLNRQISADEVASAHPVRYALYHDDPELTDEDQLRVSVAMPVVNDQRFEPPIGRLSIAPSLHAVARFELGVSDYGPAWRGLLGGWLPASGYEPSDGPYFERFPQNSTTTVTTRSVEICIPVRALST